jgi:endo-1,4-beta-xylanase
MFHSPTRKGFLIVTLTLLLMTLTLGTMFTRVSAATTLGASAALSGRFFGTSVQSGLLSNSQYNSTLSAQFSSVTPENEMKWDTTQPSPPPNSFNFGNADQIVSFAQSHNMKIRGHTLVWHNQLPGWVSSLSGSSNVLSAMNNHITTEMTHFQGKIWYWDVVNEAFNDDGTRRSDVFQNQIGNNYIADAFTTARAADPNAKLCYNDFNIEGMNAKSNAVFSMVQSFKASGVPIDCVGFQSHLIVGQVPSGFQANLQRFANLGVDVQLTELDIRMPTPASSANLTQQANDYSTVVKACLAVSRCNDMTVWGVDDGHSWVPGTFSGQGAALLFDANFQPKPAFNSVITALNGVTGVTPTPTTGITPTATPTRTPTPITTPTATPTATSTTGSSTCSVRYTVTNQWNTGFGATFTITNTGSTAINGWNLQFSFANGQTITQLWNGSFTQSGSNVTITNLSYNASLAPGATMSSPPGFNGAWSGTNTNPTSFRLNGVTCTS